MERGARARGAVQDQSTIKCLGPVGEFDQARSRGEAGPAAVVVDNGDVSHGAGVVLGHGDRDRDLRCVGAVRRYRSGPRRPVVGGYLDLLG